MLFSRRSVQFILHKTRLRSRHGISSSSFSTFSRPEPRILDLWNSATIVCFDVDSTVCIDEGIDVLAEHCGVGAQVRDWTSRAMDGNVKFEHALAARLDIIQPHEKDISSCLEAHPPQLSPSIKTLVTELSKRQIEVYLISGGFRQMIAPVAELLDIPTDRVFANTIHFDTESGHYRGFDASEFTSQDGGKPRAIREILHRQEGLLDQPVVVMVGDGVTDMQAKPPAALTIGYGRHVQRPVVKAEADWYITDFQELLDALEK